MASPRQHSRVQGTVLRRPLSESGDHTLSTAAANSRISDKSEWLGTRRHVRGGTKRSTFQAVEAPLGSKSDEFIWITDRHLVAAGFRRRTGRDRRGPVCLLAGRRFADRNIGRHGSGNAAQVLGGAVRPAWCASRPELFLGNEPSAW